MNDNETKRPRERWGVMDCDGDIPMTCDTRDEAQGAIDTHRERGAFFGPYSLAHIIEVIE